MEPKIFVQMPTARPRLFQRVRSSSSLHCHPTQTLHFLQSALVSRARTFSTLPFDIPNTPVRLTRCRCSDSFTRFDWRREDIKMRMGFIGNAPKRNDLGL